MNRQWCLIAALCLFGAVPAMAEVNPEYRLFTTSSQRSNLDGLRNGQLAVAAQPTQQVAPKIVDQLTYSGYYVSPQGEMRYWLNGQDAKSIVADDVRVVDVRPSGVMTLYHIENNQRLRIRAGQSLTLEDSAVHESATALAPAVEPALSPGEELPGEMR